MPALLRRARLDALLAGHRDTRALAVKHSAFEGVPVHSQHALIGGILRHIDFLDPEIDNLRADQRRRRAACLAERRSVYWRWTNCDTRCSAAVRTSAISARRGSSEVLAFAASASTQRGTERASRFSALHLRQHGRIGLIHHG